MIFIVVNDKTTHNEYLYDAPKNFLRICFYKSWAIKEEFTVLVLKIISVWEPIGNFTEIFQLGLLSVVQIPQWSFSTNTYIGSGGGVWMWFVAWRVFHVVLSYIVLCCIITEPPLKVVLSLIANEIVECVGIL